ncbi:MAG: hypothetical protein RBR42_00235 [Desulfomicrobium sp.]|nr:hypothetical protein [Desulfomicrobium sp.]
MQMIGGWRQDRETGKSGLTLAGLLMFGQMNGIQEALPYYMLDYQERPEAKTEMRWVDRLTLDGKWSGNLYDFYRKVYLKLIADLKVPFVLEKGERKDETPVHIALREALANVLVHADYTDRASVLVVKRPDMFGFRNPGLMRIPVEVALQGGEPDCRNRNLHKMFRFVGVGEQAGTGIPRIFYGWKSQHWNPPKLYESSEPYNQTLLELRMIDLFPSAVIANLHQHFGKHFDQLKNEERVALALAGSEGTVNHARLCTVTSAHPMELTRILQHLTQVGMLESKGSGRGAVYFLPGQDLPTPEDVFGPTFVITQVSSVGLGASSVGLGASSVGLGASSVGLGASSVGLMPQRDEQGRIISEHLDLPIINSLAVLSTELRQQLKSLASQPRTKKKLPRQQMVRTLLALCKDNYLTLQVLAELVDRNPDFLRTSYLVPLLRNKKITMAFPTTPTHEKQAYCLSQSLRESDIAKGSIASHGEE